VRRGIATVSLSGTLEEKLEAAADAGFDGVELFENDLIGSPLSPAQVRQRAEDLGLRIDLYQPFRDLEAVPDATFARNLRRAEHKLDVMEELGTDTILVCSSVSPEAVDDDALAAHQLTELAERAGRRGLRVAYEALAWGRHVSTYDHSWRIVRAADQPALGICLDSFHILSRGGDAAGIRDIPGERIFFLQLADAPVLRMDVLQWSRHHRCFPWQGGFDLAAFTGHVLAAGYEGPLSLEVFNDVFRQADPHRMAIDAMRSLILLEEALGLCELPTPARLRGHAFAELGVPAAEAAGAQDLLAAMGFEQIGPHRSKPVSLWSRGGARIVLNHAEERTGITSLALQSDDPARAAERAESLLAPRLTRRRGPHEAELDSIRAPDGTAVFLCGDDEWIRDFVALGDRTAAGARGRLLGIDHVGLSQPFELFDEAALFHRAVLGLQASEGLDIAAPDGLLHSRALADPTHSVRLALTIPRLGGGVPESLADLQHVAFACDDLPAAVEGMRAHGVPLLPIADNYYDDLAARVELDPGFLARLRELRILYDADAQGEFLHVFTHTFCHRLFFEVVQRVGAYDGYGAVNSPVRLAAQRRATVGAGAA
jgi:4-hydroxyphenylpyruvate dioxygenase